MRYNNIVNSFQRKMQKMRKFFSTGKSEEKGFDLYDVTDLTRLPLPGRGLQKKKCSRPPPPHRCGRRWGF